MQTMKKKEAFARALKVFGPWNTWRRDQHLAYGLIRGIPYSRMEKCANDNPLATMVEYKLWALGAWPENPKPTDGKFHCLPNEYRKEVCALIEWVHKPVRGPRIRPSNRLPVEAAQ
jgi:hypothetical protein